MSRTAIFRAAAPCVCAAIAATATAQELQQVQAGEHLTPIRAAVLNADMSMRSGWVDYRETLAQRGGAACSATEILSYDCFQADTDGITPIGADTDCGLATPDSRWQFADDACSQRTADDFTLEPGFGGEITRITGAFYWYGDGNNANSEQCFIAIQIWDDIDTTCTGPAIDNFLGNVIIDLGPLPNNPGTYYTYDIDVCALLGGVGIPAPADGSGGIDVILAKTYDEMLGQVTLATCAQPMLWGTAANRPGSQLNLPYWSDDDQTFDFDPGTECFDFTGIITCPDNAGTMVALYTATGDPCAGFVCSDANGDGVVTVSDIDPFIVAIQDTAQYGVLFPGIDPFCTCDTDMDGILDNFDIGRFFNALVSGSDCSGYGPAIQSVRVFLATDGLSNPVDPQSAAVTPLLENPELEMNNDYPKRLYLWIDLGTTDMEIRGFSFNVHTTGLAEITDAVLYNNTFIPAVSTTWNAGTHGVIQPADTSGDGTRWSGANAMSVTAGSASNGAFSQFDQHFNAATGAKLLGHIEVQGPGEVFIEVGDKGIASLFDAPGPDVSLGFGDEKVGLTGASFATASPIAEATLLCVGDINGDLVVDTADLGILISQFNSAGPGADLNNDGTVDTADLGILISNFNSTCGPIL